MLDLPRRGKVPAQDAAVEVASGEILAFSDANAFWDPDALRELVRPFADPERGLRVRAARLPRPDGSNQEGAYWRYENWVRALESRIGSVTAGNGAIYAVRREAYMRLDPRTSHDLSFPFNMVKKAGGLYTSRRLARSSGRSVDRGRVPAQAADDEPRLAGRARRRDADPRGYGLVYGLEILSHRALRYATPFLHVIALAANVALLGRGMGLHRDVRRAARAARWLRRSHRSTAAPRILALCRYYVLMTASLAAGLWDSLRHGTPATWERGRSDRREARPEARARRRARRRRSCCSRRRSWRSPPRRSS